MWQEKARLEENGANSMRDLPINRTMLQQRVTCPLAVELRKFGLAPDVREVSILHAKSAYNQDTRLLGINAQTAIKLHKWLTDNMGSLIALAEQEQEA
jgi:hypothetical protein